MLIIALVFSAGTLLLGIVLSARLLNLAARTRNTPELAMGLYCMLVTIGSVLNGIAFSRQLAVGSASRIWLSSTFTLLIAFAVFALAVGIWKIFYAGERWAPMAVAGVGVWIGAGWLATVLPGRVVMLGDFTAANGFFLAGRLMVYGLGAFEAFRYASRLQRRVALGLADAMTTHQIRLWGTAWVCVSLAGAGSFLITGMFGPQDFEGGVALLVIFVLNAAAWTCTWLAFFPPVAYQHWVEGASAEASA